MDVAVREYVGDDGVSPFGRWFDGLKGPAAARVTTCITRLRAGNFSSAKSVGSGVYELRIDFGPGYRVYFTYVRANMIILLGGGIKKRQKRDIETAKRLWLEYKRGK